MWRIERVPADGATRSRFVLRLLGIWLSFNSLAYLIISVAGLLVPRYQDWTFSTFAPARYGELAIMLWLLIRGAKPPLSAAVPSEMSGRP